MAIVAISVTPVGTGSPSVGDYVAEALRVVQRSGLRYELNAMHTVIEGELDEILRLIPAIHDACFRRGALRLSTILKIDDRRDAPVSMEGKVRSVLERMERP